MWVEDEGAVWQVVCDYLAGHIFPLTSARRMFPIFDQQQLEEMNLTSISEEVIENDITYESLDDPGDHESDWLDIP